NTYFLPYFKKIHIDDITDVDICRYQDWRKSYYDKGPGKTKTTITYERVHALTGKLERVRRPHVGKPSISSSTIRNESAHLRKIFEYARRRGYLERHQIPVIEDPPLKSNRRPDFDITAYRTLIRKSVWWYKNAPTKRVQFDRQLMHDWILIMANTGMRIGEARSLKWKNIVYKPVGDDEYIVLLYVKGKGKKREMVAMPRTKIYLERLRARTQFNDDDDYVFTGRFGRPIRSFVSGFNALLKHTDLAYDQFGNKRTPYSLRHTYATFALIYGRVNVYTLAVNMGTSVEMIEKHYGHVKPLQAYKELTTRYKM
ncbi:MAG: tyrosine-type recombinase/integrase, partial [Kordiimonas sp.]